MMRKEIIIGCAIVALAAFMGIYFSVTAIVDKGANASVVGALCISSMALGAILGTSALRYLPTYVSGMALLVSLVACIVCALYYEELSATNMIVACMGSGLATGACGGALGCHLAIENSAL